MHINFFFFSKNVEKREVCYSFNWFKPHMKVINRTKAVTQLFFEKSCKKLYIIKKSDKHKNSFSECLLRLGVLRVFALFFVFIFVRAILSWCLKLDISTLFTTFFL